MSIEPRIESAAIALYVAVHPSDRTPDGWADVTPVWHKSYRDSARAVLEAADKASTVTTEDELDALPVGTVVLSESYRYSLTYPNYPVSFQCLYDGEWYRGGRSSSTHAENILPARVIHYGTVS